MNELPEIRTEWVTLTEPACASIPLRGARESTSDRSTSTLRRRRSPEPRFAPATNACCRRRQPSTEDADSTSMPVLVTPEISTPSTINIAPAQERMPSSRADAWMETLRRVTMSVAAALTITPLVLAPYQDAREGARSVDGDGFRDGDPAVAPGIEHGDFSAGRRLRNGASKRLARAVRLHGFTSSPTPDTQYARLARMPPTIPPKRRPPSWPRSAQFYSSVCPPGMPTDKELDFAPSLS